MTTTTATPTRKQLLAYFRERVSAAADAPHRGLPFISDKDVLRVRPSDWLRLARCAGEWTPEGEALQALKDAGSGPEGVPAAQVRRLRDRQELRALHRSGPDRHGEAAALDAAAQGRACEIAAPRKPRFSTATAVLWGGRFAVRAASPPCYRPRHGAGAYGGAGGLRGGCLPPSAGLTSAQWMMHP